MKRLASILAGLLLAVIALLLVATIALPAVMGWVPLTVRSGSMEPTYPVGSQIIVKPLEGQECGDLAEGDVVTFMPYPDDPTLVTHRITSVSVTIEGLTTYRTKGDANGAEDPDPVGEHQVRATPLYHVPYMGYVTGWLSPQARQMITYGLAGLLFAYALYQLYRARRPGEAAHPAEGESVDRPDEAGTTGRADAGLEAGR